MFKNAVFIRTFLFLLLFTSLVNLSHAQLVMDHWKKVSSDKIKTSSLFQELPTAYDAYEINLSQFKSELKNIEQVITLPNPEGEFIEYKIRPSNVIAEKVKHLYTIKTFIGHQKDDPTTWIACDVSDNGFNAAIYKSEGTYFINPNDLNNKKDYLVYYKKNQNTSPLKCMVDELGLHENETPNSNRSLVPNEKRTYRLAIAAAGEYSQQFGGNPVNTTNVLNALASGVNIISPIYLRDLGVEFNLVSDANLVWTNPATDPFSTNGSQWVESHNAITNAIGTGAFDVGHLVMWLNTGGVAVNGICNNNSKGQGFSGANGSINQLWIDFVAHEIGHQFGMSHNFSNSCSGNVVNNFRYEPGEGSSIMSYAGVCSNGYQNFSDPFLHVRSIQAGVARMNSSHGCITNTTTAGNSANPIPDAKSNITIPKQTPFILVGSATDANDPTANFTYQWEQDDGNGPNTTGVPSCGATNSPNFAFRDAVTIPYRHFPNYQQVLNGNNNTVTWEKLPCAARVMDFSLLVRDNNLNWGRTQFDLMRVTVANTGPFEVTFPNGGETIGGNVAITWSVNGTDSHCASVDILLSLDGGNTYSVIADAVANDGSENVTLPSSVNSTARILVRCDVPGGFRSTSTFFDVSNGDFTIDANSGCPPQLVLTGNNLGGDYEADGNIASDQTIVNGSVVDYDSKTQVVLNSGFITVNGSTFCAFIDGCGGSQ